MRQPRSQGLSSLPPSVVGRETLVAAGHVTIYPSKTAEWVGTQVHLVERKTLLPHHSIWFFYHPDSGWSRDQPQPGSLFQRLREAEKRDPGNEVVNETQLIRVLRIGTAVARGKNPKCSFLGSKPIRTVLVTRLNLIEHNLAAHLFLILALPLVNGQDQMRDIETCLLWTFDFVFASSILLRQTCST